MEKLSKKFKLKETRPLKVLQFGEGNFLRAFIEWIIQTMNDKKVFNGDVAVVQPMPNGRVGEIAKQDYLYTLYLEGLKDGKIVKEHSIIDVISDGVNPYTEYQKFLEYAENEDLQFIISNTTEAGIALDKNDIDLTIPPKSFPAKLLALLKRRYEHFKGASDKGFYILPCELIDYNGKILKEILIELAKLNKLSEDFINWISSANKFYNTLVDRIVPGYPKNEIAEIEKELGYSDDNVVKGEIFHLWVIESEDELASLFPANKAGLNVLFVKNFKPYKERKVKILNGSHTAMVPIAYLMGIDTVKEAMENYLVGQYIKQFILNEVVPTIKLPKQEMVEFSSSVIERYLNPFIKHYLMSIALNSTTKYVTRILPSVLEYLDQKKTLPKKGLFALAALMVFYKGDRNGVKIELQDSPEYLEMWQIAWSKKSVKETAEYVLSNETLFGINLNSIPNFTNIIIEYLNSILNDGMEKALTKVLDNGE